MQAQLRKRTLVLAAMWLALAVTAPDRPVAQQANTRPGQSVTPLPDGRWLLVGGVGSEAWVGIFDPVAGSTESLPDSPGTRRAWHTATLLPDGAVLVAGGVDAGGRLVTSVERFDVETRMFQPLSPAGLAPRVGHSATLLTDGRVLFAGGAGPDGAPLDSADLWDPMFGGSPVAAPLTAARRGHRAELLADGTVRITGGTAGTRQGAAGPEIYDPASGTFVAARGPNEPGQREPRLAAAVPRNGATDVPVATRIALRFSPPLDVRTVHAGSIQRGRPAQSSTPASYLRKADGSSLSRLQNR
jgi:hypothetical protein